MKHQPTTIWESASRPLFVRSVWLESTNTGRALQRHFILDYEPKDFAKRFQTAVNTARRNKDTLKQSISYELANFYESTEANHEELLLVGSAKLRLQQQAQQGINKANGKTIKQKRRFPYLNRKQNFASSQNKRYNDSHIQYSRRSSLQDALTAATSSLVNPEERLAERVLHWLDLAGKTDILKPEEEPNTATTIANMEAAQAKKPAKSRRLLNANQTLSNSRATNAGCAATQRAQPAHPQRKSSNQSRKLSTASICQHDRNDSVKHLTIIFNKDGVPVRLNRPARNIDLCALSNSANTTRRLAGNLASARLYNSAAEKPMLKNAMPAQREKHQPHKNAAANRLHDDSALRALGDARKQLHIFMPSLPNKALPASVASVDETNSALSNAFSELCNM